MHVLGSVKRNGSKRAMAFARSDPYRHVASGASPSHARLALLLEQRAAEHSQRSLRDIALAEALDGMAGAAVLEVGCGTGPICRSLSSLPQVDSVIGVDPCATFIEEAWRLSAGNAKETYICASGQSLPLSDATADLVVIWTVLVHLEPNAIAELLTEARRVLRPGGRMLLGDNAMGHWDLAEAAYDPLHAPLQFYVESFVADANLARRFPQLLRSIGLLPCVLKNHTALEALH